MYPTNQQFNDECNSLSRQFQGYMIAYIDDKLIKISSTDSLISFEFTDDIYSDRLIGSFVAKTMTAKLYNSTDIDFENVELDVYMGIVIDEEPTFIPMGRFVVESWDNEKVTKIATLNCIDTTVYFNQPLKDYTKLTFPTTIDGLIGQISSIVGVEFVSGTIYPNSDKVFSEKPLLALEWTCRDIIGYLVEACGCYAKINRENKLYVGKLDLNINKTNQALYTIDKNMYSKLSIENMYGTVNSIVLSRQPANDNIYKKDDVSVEQHGLTEIQIVNNYFIDPQLADSPDIRPTTIVPIFNQLNGFYYYPFDCESFGNPSWDSGDIIYIKDVNDSIYPSMITELKTSYTGGFKQVIKATSLTKTEIDYSKGSTIYDRLNNVEIIVDKQNGIIQQIVTSTTKPTVIISATEPENPVEGLLWFDVSNIENPILKIYNGVMWVNASDVDVTGDLEALRQEIIEYVTTELNPIIEQNQLVSNQISNILSDSYVTTYEKLDLQSSFNILTTQYNEVKLVLDNYTSDVFPQYNMALTNKYERLSILIEIVLRNMDEDTNLNLIDMPILPELDGIGQTETVITDNGTYEVAKMSYQDIRNAMDEYYVVYEQTIGAILFVTKTELNTVSSTIEQLNDKVGIAFDSAQYAEGVAKNISNHFDFNADGTFTIYAKVGDKVGQFKTIISDNKIEFTENDVPVAYLSNQELVVNVAKIDRTIKIGKMTIQASANNGIVFKWEVES